MLPSPLLSTDVGFSVAQWSLGRAHSPCIAYCGHRLISGCCARCPLRFACLQAGVRCSLRLEVPLADQGGMLVPDDYVLYLVRFANEKFDINTARIKKLEELLASGPGGGPTTVVAAAAGVGKNGIAEAGHASSTPAPQPNKRGGRVSRAARAADPSGALLALKMKQVAVLQRLAALDKALAGGAAGGGGAAVAAVAEAEAAQGAHGHRKPGSHRHRARGKGGHREAVGGAGALGGAHGSPQAQAVAQDAGLHRKGGNRHKRHKKKTHRQAQVDQGAGAGAGAGAGGAAGGGIGVGKQAKAVPGVPCWRTLGMEGPEVSLNCVC